MLKRKCDTVDEANGELMDEIKTLKAQVAALAGAASSLLSARQLDVMVEGSHGQDCDCVVCLLREVLDNLPTAAKGMILADKEAYQSLQECAQLNAETSNDLLAERDSLAEQVKGLRERLGIPWAPIDCMNKLIEATTHLLIDHNCDCHGHEEILEAKNSLEAALASQKPYDYQKGSGISQKDIDRLLKEKPRREPETPTLSGEPEK